MADVAHTPCGVDRNVELTYQWQRDDAWRFWKQLLYEMTNAVVLVAVFCSKSPSSSKSPSRSKSPLESIIRINPTYVRKIHLKILSTRYEPFDRFEATQKNCTLSTTNIPESEGKNTKQPIRNLRYSFYDAARCKTFLKVMCTRNVWKFYPSQVTLINLISVRSF